MVRKTVLTVCLMAGCGWCLAIVAGEEGNRGGYKPVASVPSLMHGHVTHFKRIGELVKNPSAKDRKDSLKTEAELLAELANVNSYTHTKSDYRGWAGQLRDAALQLAHEAGGSANDTKMAAIVATMKQTCGDCHDMYQ